MKVAAGVLFAVVLALAVPVRPILTAQQPQAVSIVQLIANPAAYDGKVVQVFGFVRFEFEGSAVYLHQDDYRHSLYKNGLWLSMKEQKELDQNYALIEGVFNARNRGHLGLWSGSIEKVSRSLLWPPKRP